MTAALLLASIRWSLPRLLACASAACLAATAAGAPPIFDLDASVTYDDNVSRAELDRDIEEEFLLELGAGATKRQRLGERSGLVYRGRVVFEGHERFEALNNFGITGFLAYRFKPVSRYTSPWFSLEGSLTLREHNDSEIRDGLSSSIAALAGKRFTERVSARGGVVFEHRSAFDGEAFDTTRRRAFAGPTFEPARKWQLYGNYSVARGDVVSSARPNTKITPAAEVIEPDAAFGLACGAAAGGRLGECAYRLDATSHSLRVGANYAVNRILTLDLHSRYLTTAGKLDNDYESVLVGASLRLRLK